MVEQRKASSFSVEFALPHLHVLLRHRLFWRQSARPKFDIPPASRPGCRDG